MASGTQWGRSTRSSTTKDSDTQEATKGDENDDMEVHDISDEKEDEVSLNSKEEHEGEDSQEEGLRACVEELKSTIDKLTVTLSTVDTKFQHQEARIRYLEDRCETLAEQNKHLSDRLNYLENMGKIGNIKIDGLKEQEGENLMARILKLAEAMGSDTHAVDIDSVYRLGKRQTKELRPRTILIKFKTTQARNEYYNGRFKLKDKKEWSRVWINDDVSEQTRRRREAMRSIATLCRDERVEHKLRSDSIIIKGRRYWISELEQIPKPYSLEDAKIRCYNDDLYFQSEHAWPSNMAPARVTIDKQTYVTSEHAWNGVKAEANNDPVAAELIRKTACPYEAKMIGDKVRVTKAWEKCECDVMYEIVYQKSVENPEIKAKLLATGNKKLHEATRSTTFGIGAGLFSKQARVGKWPGKDVLGQIWEKIRDNLVLSSQEN